MKHKRRIWPAALLLALTLLPGLVLPLPALPPVEAQGDGAGHEHLPPPRAGPGRARRRHSPAGLRPRRHRQTPGAQHRNPGPHLERQHLDAPVPVTDDQQPDFAPAVAFDGSGNGVLVWERSTLAAEITPTLNITFAQSLEIATSTWDGSSWSEVVTLTEDSLMDHAPRLSAGSDGTVMALWQTNDGTDTLGTATHPLTYTTAIWDGSARSAPAAALTGLQDVVDTAFAAYSATQAALVYARGMDGDLSTPADNELYYSTYDGVAWSSPARMTTDTITDTTPALAYDAAGDLHLLWLRDSDPSTSSGQALVWLKNSWDVNDAQTVRAGSTEGGFLGFSLSRDPTGNLALVWQAMGADGADLTYSVYDAAADSWGADQTLMSDSDTETAHTPAFGGDGTMYLAYQKVATELVTRTVEISPTLTYTVTNLLTPGQSDLVFLAHTVGRDLTFDSLVVTPTNPQPGQAITLTAVLRNAGDLAVANPQVAFYDGRRDARRYPDAVHHPDSRLHSHDDGHLDAAHHPHGAHPEGRG